MHPPTDVPSGRRCGSTKSGSWQILLKIRGRRPRIPRISRKKEKGKTPELQELYGSPRIFPYHKRTKTGKWPVGILFRRPRHPIIWRCLLCRPAISLINKSMKIVPPCASILHQSIDMSNDKTYFNHAQSFIDQTQFC